MYKNRTGLFATPYYFPGKSFSRKKLRSAEQTSRGPFGLVFVCKHWNVIVPCGTHLRQPSRARQPRFSKGDAVWNQGEKKWKVKKNGEKKFPEKVSPWDFFRKFFFTIFFHLSFFFTLIPNCVTFWKPRLWQCRKKTESLSHSVYLGMVCHAEKEEKPFWFSSLGQMIQFGTIKFCRTLKNYFGQFVWIEKKNEKKSL